MNAVINSIVPVCAVILLGQALKRFNLANRDFFSFSDRLIYYIFFPVIFSGRRELPTLPACLTGGWV